MRQHLRLESVNQSRLRRGKDTISAAGVQNENAIERISILVQLSALFKARDSGEQAEPDPSGSTIWAVSPGLSMAVGEGKVYGFVQLAVVQRVHGIQLVPRTSLAIGYTKSF